MANEIPIETHTEVRKITISTELNKNIKDECDIMGAAGYQLSSSFVLGDGVVLIFQRTR